MLHSSDDTVVSTQRPWEDAQLPTVVKHRKLFTQTRRHEPNSFARWVTQIESDYQFKLGYLVLQAMIESATVSVDSFSSDDRTRVLAANLLERWKEALPHAMRAVAYGSAAFERTYRYDRASGLALVAGLDYLPFENTKLSIDARGSFRGIRLRAGDQQLDLGPEQSWWFALDATVSEPHGRSRYLGAAYEIWKKRRQLERQEEIWYGKFAIGHAVARAPDSIDSPNAVDAADIVDPMEVLRQRCSEIESGGVLVLSSKTYPNGKYLYEYAESDGQKESRPLEERRRQLDAAALRSLGIPERAITQDAATGTNAMAQTHLSVLYNTCEGILSQLAASFQKYVIRKAIQVNWPAQDQPQLKLSWQPLGSDRRERFIELVSKILSSSSVSPLITAQVVDIEQILKLADLPIVDDWRERLKILAKSS